MKIKEEGKYKLTEDLYTSNITCRTKIPSGTIIDITQVDIENHKFHGPELLDWHFWDISAKKID